MKNNYKRTAIFIVTLAVMCFVGYFTPRWINNETGDGQANSTINNQTAAPTVMPTTALQISPAAKTTSLPTPTIYQSSEVSIVPTNTQNPALNSDKTVSPTSIKSETPSQMPVQTTQTPEKSPSPSTIETSASIKIDDTDIIETMHKMSNGLIIAEDKMIWGIISMTRDKVSELLKDTKEKNYVHKDELTQILIKWKSNDFSHIADDHNVLWGYLNGNVGKAIGPNDRVKDGKYMDFK